MKTHERVKFRLIHTPCCGTLLCWVNPRLPTHCPECGVPILGKLRTDPTRILITDNDAELAMDADLPKIEEEEMIPLELAVNVLAGAIGAAQLLTGKNNINLTDKSKVVQDCRAQLRRMAEGREPTRLRPYCFRGRESMTCLGCVSEESCKGQIISTIGDLHLGCPKKGTWRQDPACTLADVCDGCGEGRA